MCLGITGVITRVTVDDGVPMALASRVLANPGPATGGSANSGRAEPLSVCLLTCPGAVVGDTVLIHSGYVLAVLDHQEVTS
jgi:hydrogenase maturation factor